VELVQEDAAMFEYASLRQIAFCLLDVDLYIPTSIALPKIFEILSPGAMIVVDDCIPDDRWDGALQAYTEFVKSRGLPVNIVGKKLGIIEKPQLI
jgi:hypothetical protein